MNINCDKFILFKLKRAEIENERKKKKEMKRQNNDRLNNKSKYHNKMHSERK